VLAVGAITMVRYDVPHNLPNQENPARRGQIPSTCASLCADPRGMDRHALDQRLNVALAFSTPSLRRELLRILDQPDEERVREIGEVYRAGTSPGFAELLMDLEEAPRIRKLMAARLRSIRHSATEPHSQPRRLDP
jgi:hypothetical protein